MDLKEKQLASRKQEIVLHTLAESVATPGCKFLEVGSWLGDSTVILAKVAQKCGGLLFCIDWWKGNIGTDLIDIASKVDIFSVFWSRICKEGLQDVIIPIRSRSDLAASIIKENSFNLVFLDADHRYDAILTDIKQYAPVVDKNGGIFCGHDCEGRVSDYETGFLKRGRRIDYYETVHCGVVLAVGETFKDYSINHSIWSVQFSRQRNAWVPTNLKFKEIRDERQTIPPPLGFSKNCFLVRYGKSVYAISMANSFSDIKTEKDLMKLKTAAASSWQEVERKIGESVIVQLESYRGHNIIEYRGNFCALLDSLDPTILLQNNKDILRQYRHENSLFIADSIDRVKQIVDGFYGKGELPQRKIAVLIEEGYGEFNIVKFGESFYAIAQDLGTVDFRDVNIENLLQEYRDKSKCFTGNSVLDVKHIVDKVYNNTLKSRLSEKDKIIDFLKKDIVHKDKSIAKLNEDIDNHVVRIEVQQQDISSREKIITTLQAEVSLKDEAVNKLHADLGELGRKTDDLRSNLSQRDKNIELLNKDVSLRDKNIDDLSTTIKAINKRMDALQADIVLRDKNIESLKKEITGRDETINKLRTGLGELGRKTDDLQSNLSQRDKNIELLNREVSLKDKNIADLGSTLKAANEKMDALQADIVLRDKNIESLRKEISGRDETINKLRTGLGELGRKMDDLQSNLSQRDKNIEDLGATIKVLNKRMDARQADIVLRDKNIESLKKEITGRDETINKLRADLGELGKKTDDLQSDLSQRDKNIELLKKEISGRIETVNKLNLEIQEFNHRVISLQATASERGESIKALNNELSKRDENITKLSVEAAEMFDYIKELTEELADVKSRWYFRFFNRKD